MATVRAAQPRPGHQLRRPRRVIGRGLGVLAAAAFVAQGLLVAVPVALPLTAATAAAAAPTLPSGFVDETLVTGLSNPTVVAYAPDGRVFVAEKRGIVKTWGTVAQFNANAAPNTTVDLRDDVMNYWDRGLLGLAVDPNWPTSNFIYVLYTYNALPGGAAPAWSNGDPNTDPCGSPPGSTTDGCVVQNRLERVTVNPATGVATGHTPLLTGWCQQFPSHSAGTVAFGPDGMLYVSAGDGASFNGGAQDFGQKGGTLPDTTNPVTPTNPCGDPPGGIGGAMSAPTAEGGALRSQSFRRPPGESAVLNGAVLRLNPATGAPAAGNPASGNSDPIRQRIVAYGLRNPFRMTFRPGTSDLYIGDVGYSTWEEVNRLSNPIAAGGPVNYGWPCHEGPETNTYYTSVTMNLCSSLSTVSEPLYDYAQTGQMATNDGCPPGDAPRAGASISGLAFGTSASYPAPYRNGLFVADYSRNCIVVLPDAGSGVPSGTAIPFESDAVTPVNLTTDPSGNIVYGDFGTGTVHRIRYAAPTASFTATPSNGTAPLLVNFDASASDAISPATITGYDWDFGDGSAHGSGVTTSHSYAAGTYTARLTVTDSGSMTATTTKQISSGNTPPSVTIDQPNGATAPWKVGDTITLLAHGSDLQDGDPLPASKFSWHVGLQHCHTPDDCHEHDLLDPTGVTTTTFVAPDHDAGSFLRITVTVTDSGGLTDSKTIDLQPESTTMTLQSSPAGLPVTLDGVSGAGSVGPETMLVGHAASVQAQSTAAIGETMYGFSSWSDGGALTHTVNAPATATTLTATYHVVSDDAPDTCAAAPVQSVGSASVSAKFGKPNDVDWIKFSVSSTHWYRFVAGNLPVDAVMTLYHGCSTALASSNAAGTHWEEILRSLTRGTYALRIASVSGAQSETPYRWQVQALSGTTPLLMAKSISTTSIRYVGDVYNTSSSPRSITIKATMYSASGKVLKTATAHPLVTVVAGRARSPFVVSTTRPAGLSYVRITVTSTSASKATRLLSVTGTASAPTPSTWKVNGTITNTSSTTAHNVVYIAEIYDAFGTTINAAASHASASTLAHGAKATFSVTFSGLTAAPSATTLRARAT